MVGYITDSGTPEGSEQAANMGYLQDTPATGGVLEAARNISSTTGLLERFQAKTMGMSGTTQAGVDALRGQINGDTSFNTNELNDPQKMKPLPMQSADYINQNYGPTGFDGKPTKITDAPLPEEVGRILGEQKKKQLDAQDTWRRYTNTHSTLTNFGVGTAGFLMDPINAASMFVPGLGEETALAGVGRIGLATDTMLARQGARVIAGATAGIAGAAPITAIKYGVSPQVLDDYSLKDAFKDMAYAAAGNAIIHAGVFGSAREFGILKPDHIMMPKKPESPIDPNAPAPEAALGTPEESAQESTKQSPPAQEQPYNIFTPEGKQVLPSDKLSEMNAEANPDASLRTYDLDHALRILNADAPTKHAALNSAVAQLADGRPIDVENIFPSGDDKTINLGNVAEKQEALAREGFAPTMTSGELEGYTQELFGKPEEEGGEKQQKPEDLYKEYASQAQMVKDEMERVEGETTFDRNNLHHVRKALGLPARPKSLLNWLRDKGGISLGKTPEELAAMKANGETIKDAASGELKGIFDGDKNKNAFYSLVKKGGRSIDELAALAREEGYFHDKSAEHQGEGRGADELTSDDLLKLIEQELSGERVYPAKIHNAIEEMFGPKTSESATMAEVIGVEKGDSLETIARKLHDYYKPSEEIANIHAKDAEHTPPEKAEEVGDLMKQERNLIAEKQLPEDYHEIIATETKPSEAGTSEHNQAAGGSEHDAAKTAGTEKPAKVSAGGGKSAGKSNGAGDRGTGGDTGAAKPEPIDDEIAFLQSKIDVTKMTQDERQLLADSTQGIKRAEAYRKGFEAAADCLTEVGA